MAPIIEVKNLTHVYSAGTPFQRTAIDNMSFSVQRGEFIGVIGHTGSGKSTLIQHLNGLLKPTEGQVLLDGEDIWRDKAFTRQVRSRVGLVFQYPEYQLFEETAAKDIAFGPKNMGLPAQEIQARVERAAGFVGLSRELLDKSVFDLSGGQKRRVAIAGVIAMEPEVLVLDEPTAGLDARGRDAILNNIRQYQKAQNATVLMVCHSMEEIAELADRILVMEKGRLDMLDTPQRVFSQAEHLLSMGLSVPEVTQVFCRLRQLGLPVPEGVYTVAQAQNALLRLKGGAGDA